MFKIFNEFIISYFLLTVRYQSHNITIKYLEFLHD